MKTQQAQKIKNEPDTGCRKQSVWGRLFSNLGKKKVSDRQDFEISDEIVRETSPVNQVVSGNNVQTEASKGVMKENMTNIETIVSSDDQSYKKEIQKSLPSSTICTTYKEQPEQSKDEDKSRIVELFKRNGILRDDEDWKDVDLEERLRLSIINKCILCWNRISPDEAIHGSMNSLEDFMRLIHGGFIGFSNREILHEWFREISNEFNLGVQSIGVFKNFKNYLSETKLSIKCQYDQLDERIDNVLRKFFAEWQKKQDEDTIRSLQNKMDKLLIENGSLSEKILSFKNEEVALKESLQCAENRIDVLKQECENKSHELLEISDKLKVSVEELSQIKQEQDKLQIQYKQSFASFMEQSEKMDEIYKIRQQWSANFEGNLKEIGVKLHGLVQKVIDSNSDSSIYRNLLERISTSYETMMNEISDMKNRSDWQEGKIDVKEMVRLIQPILQGSMKRNGWINILTYLNCYSYIPQLAREFNNHDLDILKLGELYALIIVMLGKVYISPFVPRLLIDQFDDNYYEFKNSDTWINRFCPDLSPRDYAGKIFDLVQIGYWMQGEELIFNKPIVTYF